VTSGTVAAARVAAVVTFALLAAVPAHAERYAIVVGNNVGRGVDAPLRFAESDAVKLAQVLVELGGFTPAHVQILPSPSAESVERAFVNVGEAIARAHDGAALVFFYYSGHADGVTLHLGESSLDLFRVRDLIALTRASVRIGVLDACGAGALTIREKGVSKGAPFLLSAPSELAQHGQIIIAAVSASESAQESDALRGSFFTNYFVAGLRGAADRGGSGRVTLDDAYRYAYAQTVRATMLSRAGAQHPTYNVNLSGQGDLVLTEPRRGRSRLVFRPDTSGELAIFTPSEELVAEMAVARDNAVLFALPPGDYELRKRSPDGLRVARVHIAEGQERELAELRMEQIDYVRLARKGVNPRIRIAAGYTMGLFSSSAGGMAGHLSVDVAARRFVLSPRFSFGFDIYDVQLPKGAQIIERVGNSETLLPSIMTVHEGFLGGGLAASYPWERLRYFFAVGGGVDLGGWWQASQGATERDFAVLLSAQLTAGVRLFHGLGVELDIEPGAAFMNRPFTGFSVRAVGNFLLGVRYEL
jgi:uncharacterized caspase-like protein